MVRRQIPREPSRRIPWQPSLFGVAATDPSLADLAGLLAGPGTVRRLGGTAQVSVVVDAAWRVHALVAELARRDLAASWEPAAEPGPEAGGFVVRTAFTTRLVSLAAAWHSGPDDLGRRPPPGLHLNGHALRLWVAAAGDGSPDGYLLRLPAGDNPSWPAVGAALSAAGLAGTLLVSEPAYRITGRRRLARLAELVGEAPPAAPPGAWPAAP